MSPKTAESLAIAAKLSKKIATTVENLNKLLGEANDLGIYVLIQKDETHGSPPKISLKINKLSYSIDLSPSATKP